MLFGYIVFGISLGKGVEFFSIFLTIRYEYISSQKIPLD